MRRAAASSTESSWWSLTRLFSMGRRSTASSERWPDAYTPRTRSGPWQARSERIREWIERLDPDLIGFQEALRGEGFDQVAGLLDGRGYAVDYGTTGTAPGGDWNVSEDTTAATDFTNGVTEKVATDQFVSAALGATADFTPKEGADIIALVPRLAGVLTDILGNSRDSTTAAGAFEFTVAASGADIHLPIKFLKKF